MFEAGGLTVSFAPLGPRARTAGLKGMLRLLRARWQASAGQRAAHLGPLPEGLGVTQRHSPGGPWGSPGHRVVSA